MKLTNVGYVAKLNKQKTKKGRDRCGNDAFRELLRQRSSEGHGRKQAQG